MLYCDTCGTRARDVEDLAVFVSQLAALGIEARVHVRSVPRGLSRNVRFDLAPYLVDTLPEPGTGVVLLAAHRLSDEKLGALRHLARDGVSCRAFGCFATRQAAIGARAKLSYVFGSAPELHDLALTEESGARSDAPVFGVRRRGDGAAAPRLLLVDPDLSAAGEASGLLALALARNLRVAVLTDGRAKAEWQSLHGAEIPVYHYGEVLPADLVEQVDICACFQPPEGNYRLRCLIGNAAASGVALLDASPRHAISEACDAFVRAPNAVAMLGPFLEAEILPNLADLGRGAAASTWAQRHAPEGILRAVGAEARVPARTAPAAGITMVPTNGIGLGHAQRCSLIARELATGAGPVFAAFPSCTGLIKSFGFDAMPLIGRSGFHAESFENDLANYARLRALTAGGRTLVFDGGYVFDSIYRTILENRLRGIWIRRGLWQTTQSNAIALDREKVFARVIVPREAFDELNASYSRGAHVREVGPVVQCRAPDGSARAALRATLAERYGVTFERLAVTLLGGGVAAERGAQIQTLCASMERRPDTLHLVVVWPGGRQDPAWFGWQRSRVVRTRHAGALLAAADLCVGAAGYNLFHEVLYNRVPTVFVPQTGPYMDDQRARAAAAAERDLATLVEPSELVRLDREATRLLDEGEAEALRLRLAQTELPEPGNAAAAHQIEEVHHEDAGLRRARGAYRSATRG